MRNLAFAQLLVASVCATPAWPQGSSEPPMGTDVATHHSDVARTGWYRYETTLSPAAIKTGSFGLLYQNQDLDEQVDAQPLVIHGLPVGGTLKSVVFVATENNTLYALDASDGTIIGARSFGAPVPGSQVCGNASDHLGINSTPVIDPRTRTLYLIAAVWGGTSFDYMLHAVDLMTLNNPDNRLGDKIPPVKIAASGTLTDGAQYAIQPQHSRQRAALLLANGRIYAGFSTFCDYNPELSRGWLLAWDASSLASIGAALLDHRPVSPLKSGRLDAIWMSGFGPAADASGNVFVVTGNSKPPHTGETLPVFPVGPSTYLSDSVVKFDADLKILDYFTPSDPAHGQAIMDARDADLGSGGILVLPDDGATASLPLRAVVAAGKTGQLYLLNRDDLGKFNPSGVNDVLDVKDVGSCFCGSTYFEGPDGLPRLVSSGNNGLVVWRITRTSQSLQLAQEYAPTVPLGTDYFQKGFLTAVSSNNQIADSALIWAIRRPQQADDPQALTLHVFDAQDGTHLCALQAGLWPMNSSNQAAPNVVPVIADGKVFIASYKALQVFGLGSTQSCDQTAPSAHTFALTAKSSRPVTASAFNLKVVKGTIVSVAGSTLQLRTSSGSVKVDLSRVFVSGRYGNIDPGKPVTVRGREAGARTILAESIHSGD